MGKHLPPIMLFYEISSPRKTSTLFPDNFNMSHNHKVIYRHSVTLSHSHYDTFTKLYTVLYCHKVLQSHCHTVTLPHCHTATLSHCHWHCLIDIVYVHINARVTSESKWRISDAAVAGANVLFACLPLKMGVVFYTCCEPTEEDDVVQWIRWKMLTPRGQWLQLKSRIAWTS